MHKMTDKEYNTLKEYSTLARNIRKCCKKQLICSSPDICKYKNRYCHRLSDGNIPDKMSIKELAQALNEADK